MINEILGGGTPKYGVTIKDEAGNVIDPAGATFNSCKIELYNKETKTTIVQYAYPAEAGYTTAIVENNQVVFVIPSTVTSNTDHQEVEIGVLITTDIDGDNPPYPNGKNVSVKRGTLLKIKSPKG